MKTTDSETRIFNIIRKASECSKSPPDFYSLHAPSGSASGVGLDSGIYKILIYEIQGKGTRAPSYSICIYNKYAPITVYQPVVSYEDERLSASDAIKLLKKYIED